jgi:hypothetical protein
MIWGTRVERVERRAPSLPDLRPPLMWTCKRKPRQILRLFHDTYCVSLFGSYRDEVRYYGESKSKERRLYLCRVNPTDTTLA